MLVLVAAGFIALLPFLPAADDGLDWVRRYGGKEVSYDMDWSPTAGPAVRVVDFSFATAQPDLEREARRRMAVDWDLGDRFNGEIGAWAMTFTGEGREISFVRELNWLERMLGKLSGRQNVPQADELPLWRPSRR